MRETTPEGTHGAPGWGVATVPGYLVGEPIGHGGGGAVRRATSAGGREVALQLVPRTSAARARRLAALATIEHPHLARVLDVVDVATGTAVVTELLDGPDLASLRAAREALSAEEAAYVTAALAGALDALHAHGLVHGDVAPANVLLVPERGPVLVDLAADPVVEAGTPGFVPPERRDGGPASAPGDVWSLAATVRWLVGTSGERALVDVLGSAAATDPRDRCSAAALARDAATVAAPEVRLPGPAALARGTLRASGALPPTAAVRRRRPRRSRPRSRLWLRDAAALLAGMAVALGAGQLLVTARQQRALDAGRQVEIAVEQLVRERDEAIVARDREALRALTEPGSPAAAADEALLSSLDASGVVLSGLRTAVEHVEVAGGSHAPDLRVAVVLRQAAHERTVGTRRLEVPAQPARCVVLTLGSPAGRWRVRDVEPCSAQATSQAAARSMVG